MWPYRNGSRRGREKSDLSQFGNIVKWWRAVGKTEIRSWDSAADEDHAQTLVQRLTTKIDGARRRGGRL